MKHISLITLLTLFLLSCGGDKPKSTEEIIETEDVALIQTKKDELVTQQQNINEQIKKIDDKLKEIVPDRNVPLITTFTAKAEKYKHYLELQGSVETKQNVVVTPESAGFLQRILVKEGQNVSKGQLLATIDDNGLSQQRAQLKIQADLAKTTYERQKRLWEQKIGSEIDFLQAKSNYEALEQNVNQLDKQLGKTSIRAPFSGVIDEIIAKEGHVVSPGQTEILRLVNLNNMYIETDVPESYLTSVKNGKDVIVEFPVLGQTLESEVRQTGNFINPSNRTFRVEVAVPNDEKNIKPNLTARLKINDYTNADAILIPQSIISENAAGEQYVLVVQNKDGDKATAKQVVIETGKTQDDVIEVISGLKDDDEIVDEGARSVKDGQTVRITSKEGYRSR